MKNVLLWIILMVGALAGTACGADDEGQQTSFFDKAWRLATIYENQESQFLQLFALSGRLQFESVLFDADQGEYTDEFTWRRFRFGFKSHIFQNWVLHLEGDFGLNQPLEDMYTRLTDAYVGWSPSEGLEFKVLKHSVGFTLDGATSSTRLLTLQRNALTGNLWFTGEYFTGIGARGVFNEDWSYRAGAYSQDASDELSQFETGYFVLVFLGYDFAESTGLNKGLVRLDYVYNEEDINAGTGEFSQVGSLVSQWQSDRWGLATDLSAGKGYFAQSDVWGLVVMPHYDFSPGIQVVLRYTFVTSADDNGVRLPRYSNKVVDGKVNQYNELYAGFNVYFYGHKFKWQTGLEYGTSADDPVDGGKYEGWGLTTGLRFYW